MNQIKKHLMLKGTLIHCCSNLKHLLNSKCTCPSFQESNSCLGVCMCVCVFLILLKASVSKDRYTKGSITLQFYKRKKN